MMLLVQHVAHHVTVLWSNVIFLCPCLSDCSCGIDRRCHCKVTACTGRPCYFSSGFHSNSSFYSVLM